MGERKANSPPSQPGNREAVPLEEAIDSCFDAGSLKGKIAADDFFA
jgi:hypothetical protein